MAEAPAFWRRYQSSDQGTISRAVCSICRLGSGDYSPLEKNRNDHENSKKKNLRRFPRLFPTNFRQRPAPPRSPFSADEGGVRGCADRTRSPRSRALSETLGNRAPGRSRRARSVFSRAPPRLSFPGEGFLQIVKVGCEFPRRRARFGASSRQPWAPASAGSERRTATGVNSRPLGTTGRRTSSTSPPVVREVGARGHRRRRPGGPSDFRVRLPHRHHRGPPRAPPVPHERGAELAGQQKDIQAHRPGRRPGKHAQSRSCQVSTLWVDAIMQTLDRAPSGPCPSDAPSP